jgi:hypothetical protein
VVDEAAYNETQAENIVNSYLPITPETVNDLYLITTLSGHSQRIWRLDFNRSNQGASGSDVYFRHILPTTVEKVAEAVFKRTGEGIALVTNPYDGDMKRCALFQ